MGTAQDLLHKIFLFLKLRLIQLCHRFHNIFRKPGESFSLIFQDFSHDEINRLNRVSTFIDCGDFCIADKLLHSVFSTVTVPTVLLNGVDSNLETLFRAVGLTDGRKQRNHAFVFVIRLRVIKKITDIKEKRPHPTGHRSHSEHRTADIRMVRDFFSKLRSFFHVFFGHHVSEICLRFTLDSAIKSCLVHHDEHGFHSVKLSTNQPAFRLTILAELNFTSCRSMDSHLVFNLRADHIVGTIE